MIGNTFESLDPKKSTVEGRVGEMTSNPDSPMLKRARGLAVKKAARRGLQNSSIAAQAGTTAVIDAATPIASQDAQAYNAFAQSERDYLQKANLADQAFSHSKGLMTHETDQKLRGNAFEYGANLQGYQAQHVSRIQESAEKTIADISNNPDISPQDKTTMINQAKSRRDLDLQFTDGFYKSLPAWKDRWINV